MRVFVQILRRLQRHAADVAWIVVRRELPLRDGRGALQHAQVVEKELAVEVVDLVLETAREQVGGITLERPSVAVERTDGDRLRPLDVRVDVRNGQTALFALGLSG